MKNPPRKSCGGHAYNQGGQHVPTPWTKYTKDKPLNLHTNIAKLLLLVYIWYAPKEIKTAIIQGNLSYNITLQ